MSADGAIRSEIHRDKVPLPCTKSNSCFFQPNEMFVGGSREHQCEHGDTFIIAAEQPRHVVYTTRNVTPKKESSSE